MIVNYKSKFKLRDGKSIFVQTEEEALFFDNFVRKMRRKWNPPSYFYHYQNGGHVSALKCHLDGALFAYLDIRRFFSSVGRSQVYRALRRLGFGRKVSMEVARRSVVRDPEGGNSFVLPFGFKQSIDLASIVFAQSIPGNFLREIKQNGIAISIYVDDIVISAHDREVLTEFSEELISCFGKSQFSLNLEKSVVSADSLCVFNIDIAQRSLLVCQTRFEQFQDFILSPRSRAAKEAVIAYVATINTEQSAELEKMMNNFESNA